MLSAAIVLAIAIAIYLGYKTGLNTGLFCIVFAYLIGCLVMGLKPKAVIGFWPISTMFVILSVSLFYNVAAINGTLEKKNVRLPALCLPEIPRDAALCPVRSGRGAVGDGGHLFYGAGFPGAHYPFDL